MVTGSWGPWLPSPRQLLTVRSLTIVSLSTFRSRTLPLCQGLLNKPVSTLPPLPAARPPGGPAGSSHPVLPRQLARGRPSPSGPWVPVLSTAPHPQHSGLNYEQVLSWVLPAEPKPLYPLARLSRPGPHLPPVGAPAPICFPWTPGRGSVSESATVATDVVASVSACSLSHFIRENQFPAALSWALIAARRTGSRRGHRRGHSASSPGPPPSPGSSPSPALALCLFRAS